jgi:hypothetical protein
LNKRAKGATTTRLITVRERANSPTAYRSALAVAKKRRERKKSSPISTDRRSPAHRSGRNAAYRPR